MRNKIPGLLTSSKIHETINLKPAGDVVIEIQLQNKPNPKTKTEAAGRRRRRGGGGEEKKTRRGTGR